MKLLHVVTNHESEDGGGGIISSCPGGLLLGTQSNTFISFYILQYKRCALQ
jgi:hypothetical protein